MNATASEPDDRAAATAAQPASPPAAGAAAGVRRNTGPMPLQSAVSAAVAADGPGFVCLDDAQWAAFCDAACALIHLRAADEASNRRFLDAALSVMCGRCFWAQLPRDRFGSWVLHHHRYMRWAKRGLWVALARHGAFGPECSPRVIAFVERQQSRLQRQRVRRRARLLSADG